ncbi:phosphoribosyltransferase family protein [Morganella morganii]|nr:phosphoribosyltransferase family protein [Morganella morganii]
MTKSGCNFCSGYNKKENGKNALFSLKGIPTRFRYIFSPVEISPSADYSGVSPGRILIVDDLLATGTTLISAAQAIQCLFSSAEIRAACLFSSLSENLDPA